MREPVRKELRPFRIRTHTPLCRECSSEGEDKSNYSWYYTRNKHMYLGSCTYFCGGYFPISKERPTLSTQGVLFFSAHVTSSYCSLVHVSVCVCVCVFGQIEIALFSVRSSSFILQAALR